MEPISPLLTDLYQLTMAYGYWKLNLHEREAVFHILFRKNPFQGNYAIACGLSTIIDFIKNWHFKEKDIAYLRNLQSSQGSPLFSKDFLDYLKGLRFTCDVDAVMEGSVIFANEPALRIKGPLLQGQLLESTLLNIFNFQSLIATKAARVCQAAQGDEVIEFGMRRAQGPDGALAASRASYVGGCSATSNVLAGQLYGIPVKGTHAHSWVTVFPNELESFQAYASIMPENCTLLVDTFDSIQGIKNAITVGKKLREQGKDLLGVRLDSGDLATLSINARELLDAEGFQKTAIIASNSLDEYVIHDLKAKGAKVSIWGVGTHLVTAYDHPALDGVYKLSAIRDEKNQWVYKLKLSEQPEKVSNPGINQVRRFFVDDKYAMDIMYDEELGIPDEPEMISLKAPYASTKLNDYDGFVDLLVPIFRKGKLIYQQPDIQAIRKHAAIQLSQFLTDHKGKVYPVGLEKNYHELKIRLIAEMSGLV